MAKYNKLRGLRAEHNVNQKQMAELLGISEHSYRNKELGHTDFTLPEGLKIAEFFGKSAHEIFFVQKVDKCTQLWTNNGQV